MSKRKQQNKRIQPILAALQQTLQLSFKETQIQEEINRAIIQQLLQTDVISQIKSTETLKLIIYELVLICYQQNNKKVESSNENGPVQSRIKNLLWAIKDLLGEWCSQSEQDTSKLSERKTQRQSFLGERTIKNKMRVFVSYMNQYSILVDEIEKQSKETSVKREDSKKEALINQLQNLVFKKDEQLKSAREDISILNQKIKLFEEKIVALEQQIIQTKNQNMQLINQNQHLSQELKLLITKELSKEISQDEVQSISEVKCFWQQSFQNRTQGYKDWQENQMYKIVMSQAMTIEALIT